MGLCFMRETMGVCVGVEDLWGGVSGLRWRGRGSVFCDVLGVCDTFRGFMV